MKRGIYFHCNLVHHNILYKGSKFRRNRVSLKMTKTHSYDDYFEPLCNWIRKEGCDTLVLHLPKFKNEQLKIQVITNKRVLKISGEQTLNEAKRSRFYKEVKVSNECNVYDIHAKFVSGLLYVVMPKKISALLSTNSEFQQESSVPRWTSYAKKAIKVGLTVALLSAIGAYILYPYKSFTC